MFIKYKNLTNPAFLWYNYLSINLIEKGDIMKKVLLLIASAMMTFALISCGGEKKDVVKIGVYEPASGDNGAGGKQETLGIQYANSITPTVEISGKEYKVQLEIVDTIRSKTFFILSPFSI